jgi:hypothetical protein
MITEEMAKRLDQTLDHVFALLRDGNLTGLQPALTDIEAVMVQAKGAGTVATGDTLAGLRRKAERNAACLKAAARGLRSARRRIAEVRAAATGHAAYDAQGQRLDSAAAAARVNRRF